METTNLPIACDLTLPEFAARAESLRNDLFTGALEHIEIEGGYAFRFPGDTEWKDRIDAFVASERECCRFFRFDIRYEPDLGPIWLTLTGPTGTREFIEQAFLPA
jgi:hypothetical protein